VEGDSAEGDRRFAEWYVWAKREVSTDTKVCLGAAQAAVEALESGADDQSVRVAARGSVAGHGMALQARIAPRRRAYAEWYDWARRQIGGGPDRQHAAARAALERLDGGDDATKAAAAAAAAVDASIPVPPPVASTAPPAPAVPAVPSPPPAPAVRPAPPALAAPPAPAAPAAPAVPAQQGDAGAVAAPPWGTGPGSSAPMPPAAGPTPAPAHAAVMASPYLPHPAHSVQPLPPVVPVHAYAGLARRSAAWLIDTVLLTIGLVVLSFIGTAFAVVSLLSAGQDVTNDSALAIQVAILLIAVVLAWLYYAGLESSPWQGTIGKRALGVVVTDLYGRRIGFGRATGRHFSKIVSAVVLLVGYVMTAFTERRQALHDLMAGTLVVRQEHLSLLTAPPHPQHPQHPQPSPDTGSPGGEVAQRI